MCLSLCLLVTSAFVCVYAACLCVSSLSVLLSVFKCLRVSMCDMFHALVALSVCYLFYVFHTPPTCYGLEERLCNLTCLCLCHFVACLFVVFL